MSDERTTRLRHPLFFGFLAGLIVGVGLSLVVAMFVNRVASPFLQKQAPGPAHAANASPAKPAATTTPQDQLAAVAGPAPMVAPTKPAAKKNGATTSADTNTAAGRIYLQVGSFVSPADADNRKAQLALLGFEAIVRAVDVPEKGVVHRVVVGPFATTTELDQAKEELRGNGYPSSLLPKQ